MLKNCFNACIARKKNFVFDSLLLVAFLMWSSVIFFGKNKYIDESYHIKQIFRFLKGDFNLVSQITTLPGYHAAVAILASPLGNPSSTTLRFISLLLSLISVWVFFLLTKKFKAVDPYFRTIQYVFFPISFLYFPLVYTDIFSLLMLLTAFYFLISKRYNASALFSLLSLLVRQNNIIWVLFLWVYGYALENGFSLSVNKVSQYIKRAAAYIIVGLFFLTFVLINKGIAIGDQDRQYVGFHMGNIYFFLALSGFLFIPTFFGLFKDLKKDFNKKRIVTGIIIGAVFVFTFIAFRPTLHEYNLASGFIRNEILLLAYNKFYLVYAALIFMGCLLFATMKLESKDILIFPFAAAYLIPSWLIEQRYLIIPFVFLLLFRKETKPATDNINSAYFFVLSASLIYIVLRTGIFF